MTEYDFNTIVKLTADGDKDTTFNIGVYNGNASITVWSKSSIVVKFSFPMTFITAFERELQHLLTMKPSEKVSFPVSKYNAELKKQDPVGTLYMGRDDKAIFFLGISVKGQPSMKFPINPFLSFDMGEPMSPVQRSELGVHTIIKQMKDYLPVAMALTNYKRTDVPRRTNNGGPSKINESDLF